MEEDTSVELDYPKIWVEAYNPFLPSATFNPTSGTIYLVPFKVAGIHYIRSGSIRFKFDWAFVGLAYGFTFYNGIYRMERGTGGTASTYVKVVDLGTVVRAAPVIPATEYSNTATSTSTTTVLPEGDYAVAMLWKDTSTLGASVSWTVYGATFPSAAGWWYYDDGAGATSLPATIATVGAASTTVPFFSLV